MLNSERSSDYDNDQKQQDFNSSFYCDNAVSYGQRMTKLIGQY